MNTFTFIAFFGICMLSIGNCSYSGDRLIAESTDSLYSGMVVPGNLLVSGSGAVRVVGDTVIDGDLAHTGSGDYHSTGRILVRGKFTQPGSGKVTADGGIVSY